MIVVDAHEAAEATRIVDALKKIADVAIRPLDAGDYYLVGQRTALIERKTVFDFLNSLKGRLWDQLERLKSAEVDERLLIIEGYLALYRKRGWDETAVLAMMDSIVTRWGVPILYMPDVRATIDYLAWKHKSLGETERFVERPLRVKPKDMSVEEQALFVMEGLCGPATARAVLEHFGSLGAAIAAIYENPRAEQILSEIRVGGRRIPAPVVERMIRVVNAPFSGARGETQSYPGRSAERQASRG